MSRTDANSYTGEVVKVKGNASSGCRNSLHGADGRMTDRREAASASLDGSPGTALLDAWFELNYRLQEEAGDTHINRAFVEQWIMRLWAIVPPRPECFWLFLARVNELALLCASRYVDCCEFTAADELLVAPDTVFLHIEGGRTAVSDDAGCCARRGREPIPGEMKSRPLLPCLYHLLRESGYMSEDYLLSVSYRTYRIRQVARMLTDLGVGNMEQIAAKLSRIDVDRRRDVQSRLCLFDRKTFNELGRALHLFMLSGKVDHEYVGKYLRG